MTHEELYSAVRAMTPERFNVNVSYDICNFRDPEWAIVASLKGVEGLVAYGKTCELALMEYAKRIARLWEAK
jgi:hypothetical protein